MTNSPREHDQRTKPGVCTRCGDTRLIPIGDGYSVNPCPNCTGQQPGVCPECKGSCRTGSGYLREDCPACNGTGQQPTQLLAKHQPCGCIVCTCEDDLRCHGCGAWHCGTHPVSEIPNAVYEQPAQPGSGEVVKVSIEAEAEKASRG